MPADLEMMADPPMVVVGFTSNAALDSALKVFEARSVEPKLLFAVFPDSHALRQHVQRNSGVRYAQNDNAVFLSDHPAMPDPYLPEQWGLHAIAAPAAWQHHLGSVPISVAIIDSGIQVLHQEFEGRLSRIYDFTRPSGEGIDECGHGTAVAGTLGARRGNGVGIAGVTQNPLIIYKAFSQHASGACFSSWSVVASALAHAVDHGARVVSLSLGSMDSHPAMVDAIEYAASHEVVLVAAAGNHGPCSECLLFPANDPRVIAVGCMDSNLRRCNFSADGHNLAVLAPGRNILTTTVGNGYGEKSGTSLAVPFVSGVAANVLSANPHLTPGTMKSLLASGRWHTDSGVVHGLNASSSVLIALVNTRIQGVYAKHWGLHSTVDIYVQDESLEPKRNVIIDVTIYGVSGTVSRKYENQSVQLTNRTGSESYTFVSLTRCSAAYVEVYLRPTPNELEANTQDDFQTEQFTYLLPDAIRNGDCRPGGI